MKKRFSVGLLIICITLLLSACGKRDADYIKEYSKELKMALGDYTYVKKESKEDFMVDGARFWTTEYLEWQITYEALDGSTKTFTLENLHGNESFYSQITDECIRNIESEVKDVVDKAAWTDDLVDIIIVDVELDEAEKDGEFMLYPGYTDLKRLASKYDCTITLGVNYGFDEDKLRKVINELIAYGNSEVNFRVSCDLLLRGDIDPFVDERFIEIYLYKNGECILDNLESV